MTDTKPQPLTETQIFNARQRMADLLTSTTEEVGRLILATTAERAARLAAEAERDRLREALRPLAVLKVPYRPQGNAGAYSIRFSDIERAHAALAGQEGGNG